MFREDDPLEFVNSILGGQNFDLGHESLRYRSTGSSYRPFYLLPNSWVWKLIVFGFCEETDLRRALHSTCTKEGTNRAPMEAEKRLTFHSLCLSRVLM
jgi:hypothetical protein